MSAPRSRWLSLALVASCLVVQAACCWAEGTTMQYRLVIGTPERPQELGMDILPVKCKLEKAGDATIEPVAILKLPAFRSGVAKLRCSLAPSARLREVTAGLPVEDEPKRYPASLRHPWCPTPSTPWTSRAASTSSTR